MGVSQEVVGVLVRLEGKPSFIAGMQEESGAVNELTAANKRAAGAADQQAAAAERQRGTAAMVNKAMAGVGISLAVAAFEGVKMAINFDRQMEMIHTQAGASQAEVESLKGSVLELAGSVPQGPQKLAEGLFHLESIGLRGAAAMSALKIAAQGAAVGNANLEDTTTALGSAWLVKIKGAGDLADTMGILNATVGQGNMRMGDLVTSLGTGILPAAKVAGLGITDVGAAIAVLSDEGYKASSGAAQLATALHFLYAPTHKARGALESMGLTQKQLVNELSGPKGLHGALELLHNHLLKVGGHAEQVEKMGEILPGGRGRVLMTLMNQLDRLGEKQRNIRKTSGQFGEDVKRTMEQPAIKLAKAWSYFQARLIDVGHAMEGPAASALMIVATAASGFLGIIMSMTDHGKMLVPIIVGLTGAWLAYKAVVIASSVASLAWGAMQALIAAGAVMEGLSIDSLALAFMGLGIAMDTAGIGLIFLAITALIAVVYLLVKHFGAVEAAAKAAWNWIKHGAMDAWGWIKAHWPLILAILIAPFIVAAAFIWEHKQQIINALGSALHWVEHQWPTIRHYLEAPFVFFWHTVVYIFNWIKKEFDKIVKDISKFSPGKVFGSIEKGVGSVVGSVTHEMLHPSFTKPTGAVEKSVVEKSVTTNSVGGSHHLLGYMQPAFAEGGTMPYSGWATVNENVTGESIWLPTGSHVQPSSATSMQGNRAHTPTPVPAGGSPMQPIALEAVLVMPNGNVLAKLVTKSLVAKEALK